MNAMTFNTLDAVRRIQAAGLDRAHAEAVVDEIAAAQEHLFTKTDGEQLRAELKADVQSAKAELDVKIEAAKAQLVLAMLAIVGFADGILFFALRH